ncbi:hypothetical protein HXP44_04330 [Streptomyces sioyaensis]|uniref:Uncharacterized protein n=1 Tax=Streptomyces sioyaensis TaxID=67364 RepID=A0A4Q1QQ94_9ACTN|nr:DUF6615 family protein [Streptomyces sioyaensis]MBM4791309.1 hypothetical protein [Streptomyces sioyaensis]RXS65172.1 hypothetical protein EST54_19465 [Streptomyces sioyaensis]
MSLCACGEELADHFAFCPSCGIDLRSSAEVRGTQPSSSARSLCRTLRACATRTFERLGDDHFAGSVPGEETYTQLNLQDIRRLHSDRVKVREFQRYEEARNGADWEWWFYSGAVGFGMRVQAKRAKRGGGYDLEHVVRSTGARQSQLLVQDALTAECLPAYVLYNHRNWVPTSESGRAVDCRHGRGEQTQLGCTIVSALTVHAVLRTRPVKAAYVRDQSVPWHRLLCDAPRRGRPGLEAAHAKVTGLHHRGVHDLRAAVRAEIRWVDQDRDRYDATPGYGPWTAAEEPDPEREDQAPWSDETEFDRREQEVLGMPVYRGLNEVAGRQLSPLPDRVMAMIHGEAAQPPDARVAGAMVVDLSD